MAKVKQNLQYLALHKGEFSLPTTEVQHSLLIRISISSHLRTYSKHICVFTVYVFIVHQLDSIHVVGRISQKLLAFLCLVQTRQAHSLQEQKGPYGSRAVGQGEQGSNPTRSHKSTGRLNTSSSYVGCQNMTDKKSIPFSNAPKQFKNHKLEKEIHHVFLSSKKLAPKRKMINVQNLELYNRTRQNRKE